MPAESGPRNDLSGSVNGPVVQAGSILGGVHFHQPANVRAIPRQLPNRRLHFAGREAELTALTTLLDSTSGSDASMGIAVITGTAGVGKTTLAMQWAHQQIDRFPDGQLYIDMHGFSPEATATGPAEAIRALLDAFEVPADRIPVGIEVQSALLRTILAERRALLLIDNVRDPGQVRSLLPGGHRCFVLITSRNALAGLVAMEGAASIRLDLLQRDEAYDLLAGYLGAGRLDAEPEAVAALIARCAYLPLALAIVAARAATNPTFRLAELAAELADAPDRLDMLDVGESERNLRSVFDWSYRDLSPTAARMFRLLGIFPCPAIGLAAAACLAGVPRAEARRMLGELSRAQLLDEYQPSRYRFHDLLRTYAHERATAQDEPAACREAMERVLNYYLASSFSADRQLDPSRAPIALEPLLEGVTAEALESWQQAVDWFAAEQPNLVAAIESAGKLRFDRYAWKLPWALNTYCYWRADWTTTVAVQQVAVDAALRLDDRPAQIRAFRGLGRALNHLERYADALTHNQAALGLAQEIGDLAGQAASHHALTVVLERQGDFAQALHHARSAKALSKEIGNRAREARATNDIGRCLARMGEYAESAVHCELAAQTFGELNDPYGEAHSLDDLGLALLYLGRSANAIGSLSRAVELHRMLGNQQSEADTWKRLCEVHAAAGDRQGAELARQQELRVLNTIGRTNPEDATWIR